MTKITILVMLVTSSVLGGCGSAQMVSGNAGGGRIALSGGYMPAMAEARMVMLEHCDGRFAYAEDTDAVDFTCGAQAEVAMAGSSAAVAGLR